MAVYQYYLLYGMGGGWFVIGDLGGATDRYGSFQVDRVEERSIGPARVIALESIETHASPSGRDWIEIETRSAVYCPVSGPTRIEASCPLHVPIHERFARGNRDARAMHTEIERATEVRVGEDGTATVRLLRGNPAAQSDSPDPDVEPVFPDIRHLLGAHRLW